MAKKKHPARPEKEERSAADYYRLNTKAVDDLVNATAENSPPVSREELKKYRAGGKLTIADWLKAVLIKAWFGGVVCYFVVWGLGIYVHDQLDLLLIAGIALGFVTDLIPEGAYVCACGPEPMLKAVYNAAFGGQFSFEARMGCGYGACMGCTCATVAGPKRICKEGPVLFKEEILW